MPYRPIDIPAHVGPRVEAVVRCLIDPRLSDVHSMLRLPLSQPGLEAACNFAIADVLFGVIDGVAAMLWPRGIDKNDARTPKIFDQCVVTCYPADEESHIDGAFSAENIAKNLRAKFRNFMGHSLGIAAEPAPAGGRTLARVDRSLEVFRDWHSPSEADVCSLEADAWPTRALRPTMQIDGRVLRLNVEPFYRGTRRMVSRVLARDVDMREAEISLAPFFAIPNRADRSTLPAYGSRLDTAVTSGTTLNGLTADMPPLPDGWLCPPDPK